MNSLIQDSYVSYVNLAHRKDRLESITSQLDNLGIKATRTPGIYPHERTEEKKVMTKMLSRKQVGALGCFLAQVDIMKEAARQGKNAIVFEDDIIFCQDFMKRMDYIDKWAHTVVHCHPNGTLDYREWDAIWLGGTFHVGGKGPYWHTQTIGRDAELTDDPRMIRTYGSFSTFGYIVNKNRLPRIIKMLEESYPSSIGIDYSFIQMSPRLLTFAFVPGCLKQMDNASDQHEGAFTTFSNFAKLNGSIENSRYWYQDKMEEFDPATFHWQEAQVTKQAWQQ
jgi:GR25 family glycosyltransferase involved in LPS biosynthesis